MLTFTLHDDGRMVTLTGDNKGGDTDPGGNRMLTRSDPQVTRTMILTDTEDSRMLTMMLVITDTDTDPDDRRMLTLTHLTADTDTE